MRRGKQSLHDFRFGTSVGRFLSDGAASMAIKGLIVTVVGNGEKKKSVVYLGKMLSALSSLSGRQCYRKLMYYYYYYYYY